MTRIMTFTRKHWAIMALLALAALIRVLVMVAYQPAFSFLGDSRGFINHSLHPGLNPANTNGLGYAVALKVFRLTGTFYSVVAVQHIAGLLIAVAIYALLYQRGVPAWLASLAAAPVLFDSLQVTLEHYLLGETLFTVLALTGVLLLMWPRNPSWLACSLAGVAIMLSWFTRPSTIPVVIILVVYLWVRRVGGLKVIAFVGAFCIPYLTVLAWVGDRPSAYGNSFANRALYSRVAGFVDCDKLTLSEAERALCPPEPLGQRHDRPDWYGWNGPALEVPRQGNTILRDFAIKAISAQPGDYAQAVVMDLAPHFLPGDYLGPEEMCLREKWSLPTTIRGTSLYACVPALATFAWEGQPMDSVYAPPATGLSTALSGYSKVIRTGPTVITIGLILVLVAALTYRPRLSRDAQDAIMLAFVAGSLIVPPVLVAMYEARYALPALPFACLMAGLAINHLALPRAHRIKPSKVAEQQPPLAETAPTS